MSVVTVVVPEPVESTSEPVTAEPSASPELESGAAVLQVAAGEAEAAAAQAAAAAEVTSEVVQAVEVTLQFLAERLGLVESMVSDLHTEMMQARELEPTTEESEPVTVIEAPPEAPPAQVTTEPRSFLNRILLGR